MPRRITLQEVIANGLDSATRGIIKICPGIVQKYYPDVQAADVQLATTEPLPSITDDSIVYEVPANVPQAKVAFPGGGGFTISWHLAKGDHVTCLFFDLYVEDYRQSGQQSNPTLVGKHLGYSCLVLPGSVADASIIADHAAADAGMIIGKDGDQAQIRFTPGIVQLGATGGDWVALASKVDAELVKIQQTLTTGTSVSGGAVSFGTPYTAGTVDSAVIKAQ